MSDASNISEKRHCALLTLDLKVNFIRKGAIYLVVEGKFGPEDMDIVQNNKTAEFHYRGSYLILTVVHKRFTKVKVSQTPTP